MSTSYRTPHIIGGVSKETATGPRGGQRAVWRPFVVVSEYGAASYTEYAPSVYTARYEAAAWANRLREGVEATHVVAAFLRAMRPDAKPVTADTYILEYRDSNERWHRLRGRFATASAAIQVTSARMYQHGWRVLDADGKQVADHLGRGTMRTEFGPHGHPMVSLAKLAETVQAIHDEDEEEDEEHATRGQVFRMGDPVIHVRDGGRWRTACYVLYPPANRAADPADLITSAWHSYDGRGILVAHDGRSSWTVGLGGYIVHDDDHGSHGAQVALRYRHAAKDAGGLAEARDVLAYRTGEAITSEDVRRVVAWVREWAEDTFTDATTDELAGMSDAYVLRRAATLLDGGLAFVLDDVRRVAREAATAPYPAAKGGSAAWVAGQAARQRADAAAELADLERAAEYGREHPYAGHCGDDDAVLDRIEELRSTLASTEPVDMSGWTVARVHSGSEDGTLWYVLDAQGAKVDAMGGWAHEEDARHELEDAQKLAALSPAHRAAVETMRANCPAPGDWGLALDIEGEGLSEYRYLVDYNRDEPVNVDALRALVGMSMHDAASVPGSVLVTVDGDVIPAKLDDDDVTYGRPVGSFQVRPIEPGAFGAKVDASMATAAIEAAGAWQSTGELDEDVRQIRDILSDLPAADVPAFLVRAGRALTASPDGHKACEARGICTCPR